VGPNSDLAVLHPPYPTVHCDGTGAQARPALHHVIGQPDYVELTRLLQIVLINLSFPSRSDKK
jgi:hypothetical protein